MEGPSKKIESEFKFYPHEFQAEMEKFIKEGYSEEEARNLVLTKELVAQKKQKLSQKETVKDTRYNLGDKKDWAA